MSRTQELEVALAALVDLGRRWLREEIRSAIAETRDRRVAGELVTVADYAGARGLAVSTVRKAIREERLDVTRIGRMVRVAGDAQIRATRTSTTRAEVQLGLVHGGKR